MLLTTAQCIGQPPTKKNRPAQNISSAEAEKYCSKSRLNGPSSRLAKIEGSNHPCVFSPNKAPQASPSLDFSQASYWRVGENRWKPEA